MLPQVETVDMKQEILSGNSSLISRRLYEKLTDVLEEKKQAIIAQYESDKAGLQEQLLDAILHDDTESQGEIKAEMTVVDEAFDEAIKGLEV